MKHSWTATIKPTSNYKSNGKCEYFDDVESYAEQFVESIVQDAEAALSTDFGFSFTSETSEFSNSLRHFTFAKFSDNDFLEWPVIKNFNIELGAKKINEYLASFSMQEEWTYAVYFLRKRSDNICSLYDYQVIWSLPTHCYPIAQATASVYFTIEVPENIPSDCLVKVSFCLETCSLWHKPGEISFRENWLNWILDGKIHNFKKFKF